MAQLDEIVGKKNIAEIVQLNEEVIKLASNFEQAYKNQTVFTKGLNQIREAQEKVTTGAKNLTAAEKESERIKNQTATTIAKVNAALSGETNKLEVERQKLQSVNRETKLKIAANEALGGSYRKIEAEMSKNIQKIKQMEVLTAKDRKARDTLAKTISKQNAELKKLDAQMGIHNRNVGNYTKSITGAASSLLGAFGIVGGMYMFASVMKNATRVVIDFEKSMSKVRAITKATDYEFGLLEGDAQRLGASTEYTAAQVASLQVEYGKLGFKTKDILNVTEATLNLATAADTDLARAAEVAGGTLRAFGLQTTQTGHVVDVMADSFTSSALDIERWQETMKYAAPIAKVANISMEETAAMASILADSMIVGSQAGTSLKKIFSEIDTSSKPLRERLKELAEKGLTLSEAEGEVGERAKAALLVLLDHVDKIPLLTEQYENATGAATDMANVMRDNLAGAIKTMQSAWEGMILSTDKSENVLGSLFRGGINVVIGGLTEMFTRFSGVRRAEDEQIETTQDLIDAMTLLNTKYSHISLNRENEAYIVRTLSAELGFNTEQTKALTEEINRQITAIEEKLAADKKAAKEEADAQKAKNAEIARKAKEAAAVQVRAQKNIQDSIQDTIDKTNEFLALLSPDEPEQKKVGSDISLIDEDALQERFDELLKDGEEFYKEWNDKREKDVEDDRDAWDRKLQEASKYVSAIAGIGDQVLSIWQTSLNNQMNALEQRYQYEINLAGDNELRKEAIDKKYDKERRALMIKQAKQDKTAAIFQSIINGAQAILQALANLPPPASYVFAALSGALAAIQIGLIASEPIPAFAKGTKSAPDGPMVVGEKGRELIQTKSGKLLMANEPTVMSGIKGARIFTNKETERLLSMANLGFDSKELQQTMDRNNERLIRTIQKMKPLVLKNSAGRVTDRRGSYYGNYERKKIYE